METIVYFFLLGVLGGAAHALMDAKGWEELTKFECIKSIILGGFTSGIYYFVCQQYNLPEQFMAIVAGYTGTDFLTSLIVKVQKAYSRR